MDNKIELAEPIFERRPAALMAGLVRHFMPGDSSAIPALWQDFGGIYSQVANLAKPGAFGIALCWDEEKGRDYMAAVEVASAGQLPAGMEARKLSATTYAKFTQPGHISLIRDTIGAIFGEWLPRSGRSVDPAAPMIEYYPPGFDPSTGKGGYEIWLPVKD